AVAVMCFAVAVPVAWSAHGTYVYRDALTSIFRSGGTNGKQVDADDPFDGQDRVNILLLGGDAAEDRSGVRTDSMTVASIDTRTGDTVLLSLPRNLEGFQLPPGPARDRFPYGFTGDGPQTPGLLNEVFQYAEDHPDVVPGVPKNERGPELLKATIAGILDLRIDYYILVDMFGFADIIDAMGGVEVTIEQPIPYGLEGAVLEPGRRTLTGKEALWYGRSRTGSSDYVRMGRQKCLLAAIAEQADPQTVLTSFDKLAAAAKRTLSTDIPQELLPALVKLSDEVKNGAQINSLQFVPPLIYTGNPDFDLIRRLTAEAVSTDPRQVSGAPTGSPSPSASTGRSPGTPSTGPSPPSGAEPSKLSGKPVSLQYSCPCPRFLLPRRAPPARHWTRETVVPPAAGRQRAEPVDRPGSAAGRDRRPRAPRRAARPRRAAGRRRVPAAVPGRVRVHGRERGPAARRRVPPGRRVAADAPRGAARDAVRLVPRPAHDPAVRCVRRRVDAAVRGLGVVQPVRAARRPRRRRLRAASAAAVPAAARRRGPGAARPRLTRAFSPRRRNLPGLRRPCGRPAGGSWK